MLFNIIIKVDNFIIIIFKFRVFRIGFIIVLLEIENVV